MAFTRLLRISCGTSKKTAVNMTQLNQSISILVTHVVRRGCEDQFTDWSRGIADAAHQFDGFEGSVLFPPSDTEPLRYHLVFSFSSMDRLQAFWKSEEYADWRRRLEPLVSEPSAYHYQNGLEHWFGGTTNNERGQPSTFKMAVIVFIAILPLTWVIPPLIHPVFQSLPVWIEKTLTTIIIVGIMSYAAMPLLTRTLSRWLFPEEDIKVAE